MILNILCLKLKDTKLVFERKNIEISDANISVALCLKNNRLRKIDAALRFSKV